MEVKNNNRWEHKEKKEGKKKTCKFTRAKREIWKGEKKGKKKKKKKKKKQV